MNKKVSSESVVKDIRRRTRKKYSSEEKIRIVLDGLRGEDSISSLCRREGIPANLYYRWSKDFLEAGKKRLMGDTTREASSHEVVDLKKENEGSDIIGPILLIKELEDIIKFGDVMNVVVGKFGKSRKVLESENVYGEDTVY